MRLMASVGLLGLAACGGGGGTTTPVTIGTFATASLNGNAPLLATGASTPSFPSTTNPVTTGTVFPLNQLVIASTNSSVTSYTPNGGATLTLTGTATDSNGDAQGIFEVKIPSLNIDATNVQANAGASYLGDGRNLALSSVELNYTMLNIWTVQPSTPTGTVYTSYSTSGYQTPSGSVPTTGTATYNGVNGTSGGVVGVVFGSAAGKISAGALSGNASVQVNFANGAVNGSLTNMNVVGTTNQAWNNVSLTGTLSGASISGTTGVTSTPSGTLTMGSGSSGTFAGALYGPNGEELGAVWSLHDPNGTKSAVGVIGAGR